MHTEIKTVTIGISGGLDSTLALLVAIRAFDLLGIPRKNVYGITMPGFGTTNRTYNNAKELVTSLGATLIEIPISEAVELHFKNIEHDISDKNIVYENAQARERTQILMDIANKIDGLVVGTGNMSELALGWATYNGDHMSMYGVNTSVPKTLCEITCSLDCDTQMEDSSQNILHEFSTLSIQSRTLTCRPKWEYCTNHRRQDRPLRTARFLFASHASLWRLSIPHLLSVSICFCRKIFV
jgi:NAD+ synthase (glutamine-hydrolysing)